MGLRARRPPVTPPGQPVSAEVFDQLSGPESRTGRLPYPEAPGASGKCKWVEITSRMGSLGTISPL
jgi:hypothetical protein